MALAKNAYSVFLSMAINGNDLPEERRRWVFLRWNELRPTTDPIAAVQLQLDYGEPDRCAFAQAVAALRVHQAIAFFPREA
jgi:hypothetical protein